MFSFFYLKTTKFLKSLGSFRGKLQEILFFWEEPSERIQINRAWEKDSKLPSPIL
jgi:hypothetical protein